MNVPDEQKGQSSRLQLPQPEVFAAGKAFFLRLAGAEDVKVCGMEAADAASGDDGLVEVTTHAARLFMPLAELVDFEKELARIAKEKENCLKQIAMFESKLSNEAFVSRAPEKVVSDQKEKLAKNQARWRSSSRAKSG